jgi:hypothetical protein
MFQMTNFEKINFRLGNLGKSYFVESEQNLYVAYSSKVGTIHVKCKCDECPARGKIEENTFFRTNSHGRNHEDHISLRMAVIASRNMKELAAISSIPLRQIYDEGIENLSDDARIKSVESTLRKIRNKQFPTCRSS